VQSDDAVGREVRSATLTGMRELHVHVARWSALHPWRAVVGWVLFVAVCLGSGAAMGTHTATTEDYRVGEAGRAEAMAAAGSLTRSPTEQVLISSRSGPLDGVAAGAAARDVTTRMQGLARVEQVAPPRAAADGASVLVQLTLTGSEDDAKSAVESLRAQTDATQRAYPQLSVEETGSPSISKGVDEQRGSDLAFSEAITLPATLITLLLVFGSVLVATVPLVLALSSIAAAMGLAMLISHLSPDAGVGNNIIVMIGLAVGVDYTLFYLKREREERARQGGRLGSAALVEIAARTSGRAVVVSGVAVAVSTASLYLAADVIFSSLATATIIVVLVAMASSLTALPALLVLTATRAERRAARHGLRPRRRRDRDGLLFRRLLLPATKHPVATLCGSVLVLLGLAAPALGLHLVELSRDTHSREIPAMQTYDRLNEAFPDLRVTHQVVARAAPGGGAAATAAMQELARRALADPLFTGAPVLRTSPDGLTSSLELSVPHRGDTAGARESLQHLRADLVPETVGALPGVEAGVTGDVARYTDYPAHQAGKLPLVLGALLLVTFATTALAFGSVVLGLVGMVLNALSAAAATGLLVAVFQSTWAQGLLDFQSTGSIGSRVPLFLLVILFGLSMDYQIFVLSRIREAADRGLSTRESVIEGMRHSAGVVTSAAIVMVTVFVSFVFLHLLEMKQIGFVLAAAVLLDAFIIRILTLPAVLLLLGRRIWWPDRRGGADDRHGPNEDRAAVGGHPAEVT
jgi:RND superfamily putative drug exporter